MPEQVATIQRQFLSQYLASEARTIAREAAGRLVANFPEVANRFAPRPEAKWQPHLEGWATDLSAAVHIGCPEVFAARLRWCTVAFSTRGVPLGDLAAALDAFRHTLGRHVPAEDDPTLQPYLDAAAAKLQQTGPETSSTQTVLPKLATAFLVAVLEGERTKACNIVIDAVRSGAIPARDVSRAILTPVMVEVGRLWHLGELTVAEEHVATSTVQTVQSQVQLFVTPSPRNGLTLLAGSVEGNPHDLGIRFLADAFEAEGWRTIYLGSSVPVEEMARAVLDFEAHLIALSAALPHHLPAMADAIAAVRAARPENPARVMIGGGAVCLAPEACKELGADAVALGLEDALSVAAAMFGLTPPGGSGR